MLLFPITAAVTAVAIVSPAIADDRPVVFADDTYESARDSAMEQDRTFIVYATASWCPPCKTMKKSVWPDGRVIDWVDQNAVAYYLDVDKEPRQAQALRIRAMPTMVAFRGGKEVDRIVGGRNADRLLEWFGGLESGTTAAERLEAKAGDRVGPDGKVDIRAREQIAKSYFDAAELDKATDEYLWLWNNMNEHEPAMMGVRVSFMAEDLRLLCIAHKPALEAFAKIRDAHENDFENGDTEWDSLLDWIVLNEITREPERTIAWIDRNLDSDSGLRTLRRLDHKVEPILFEQGRWADAAKICEDPFKQAEQQVWMSSRERQRPDSIDEASWQRIREFNRQRLIDGLAKYYTYALFQDRGGDTAILELAREHDDENHSVLREMISTAAEAGVAQPEHIEMLREIPGSEQLIARVRESLGR